LTETELALWYAGQLTEKPSLSSEDRAAIVKQFTPMVNMLANRQVNHGAGRALGDSEDCYQVGAMGLLNAIEKFNPTRGIKFITYAYKGVSRHIWSACYRQGGIIRVPYGVGRLAKSDHPDIPLVFAARVASDVRSFVDNEEEQIRDKDRDEPEANEANKRLHAAIATLTPREQIILERMFFGGYTLKRTGEELGVTKERIRQIRQAALKQLKEILS
jgi:RNA polymerase sigma factor (sigma-70 family)